MYTILICNVHFSGQDDAYGRFVPAQDGDPVVHHAARGRAVRADGARLLHGQQPLHGRRQEHPPPMGMVLRDQKGLEGLDDSAFYPTGLDVAGVNGLSENKHAILKHESK